MYLHIKIYIKVYIKKKEVGIQIEPFSILYILKSQSTISSQIIKKVCM